MGRAIAPFALRVGKVVLTGGGTWLERVGVVMVWKDARYQHEQHCHCCHAPRCLMSDAPIHMFLNSGTKIQKRYGCECFLFCNLVANMFFVSSRCPSRFK